LVLAVGFRNAPPELDLAAAPLEPAFPVVVVVAAAVVVVVVVAAMAVLPIVLSCAAASLALPRYHRSKQKSWVMTTPFLVPPLPPSWPWPPSSPLLA
jgi:uncharacterized membrane protein YdfJ with MMPL/SSD domain